MTRWTCAALLMLTAGCSGGGGGGKPGAPTISLTAPAASQVHTNASVAFQALVDGDVDEVTFLVDDAEFAILSPPWSFTLDTSGFAEGPYTVRVRAEGPGGTAESTAVTVVVDRTAPNLVSRTPAVGDPDVWLGRAFVAEFSEPLDPTSVVAGATVAVHADTLPDVPIAVIASGAELVITVLSTPPVPATLEVRIDGVRDLAGNAAAVLSEWSFNAPEWASVGGTYLDVNPELASIGDLDLVLLPGGAPVLAWSEGSGGAYGSEIYAAFESASGDWQLLGDGGFDPVGDVVRSVALATHVDGTIYLAFVDISQPFVRRWTGNTWTAVGGQIESLGTTCYDAVVGVGADGAPVIAWVQDYGLFDAFASRWDGSDWVALAGGDPMALNVGDHQWAYSVTFHGSTPYFGVHDQGARVVTPGVSGWEYLGDGPIGGAARVEYGALGLVALTSSSGSVIASHWNGADWLWFGDFVTTGLVSATLDLALLPSGDPVVAWSDASDPDIHVSAWNGESWDVLASGLKVDGDLDASRPSVAVDGRGSVVVAWKEGGRVYVRRRNSFSAQ